MRKTVTEKTLSWSPAPAATGSAELAKTRQSFLRNLLGRCAGLLEIKHLQNSGYRFLKNMGKRGKKRGGGGSLWSQVVAPAHARCVFYCFLIIVQLLLGRIYWNTQPARLLTAYEADTSLVTAAAVRRGEGGEGGGLIFAWPCRRCSSCTPVGGTRSSSMVI